MSEGLLVKAGGIQSLADARYFSSREVDWIGFCFDPQSSNYIAPHEAQQIIQWLQGPKIVGEFGNQPINTIKETALILNLDGVQLSRPDNMDDLNGFKTTLFLDLSGEKEIASIIADTAEVVDYYLIDEVPSIVNPSPFIATLDFNSANWQKKLDSYNWAGINISGQKEEKIGEKSFEAMDEFFELLQDEF